MTLSGDLMNCKFIEKRYKIYTCNLVILGMQIWNFTNKNKLSLKLVYIVNNLLEVDIADLLKYKEMALCIDFSQVIPDLIEVTS